jgi:D-alanine-D-alanine ligase
MSRRLRVAVLSGGRSSEHEISVASARSVVAALDPARYDVVPVTIGRDGGWELPPARRAALLPGGDRRSLVPAPNEAGAPDVVDSVDVVMPVLHGPFGEDGTVQGLLEMAGLPYVGSGVLGAALTMDKAVVKHVLRDLGIAVARSVTLRDGRAGDAAGLVAREIGYPCFVKPARLGSSVGITRVHEEGELPAALALAFTHDSKILVEEELEGREVEVGVLGNEEPIASVPGAIHVHAEWYDYRAKYEPGGMTLEAPARLPERVSEELRTTAVRAFEACECAGMARIDFFVTPDERVVLNELNAIPGFTETSVYARLFEASGIPYAELLDRLIALALARHADASRLQY